MPNGWLLSPTAQAREQGMFKSLSRFTVLIERRLTPHLWMLALLLLLASVALAPPQAVAQSGRGPAAVATEGKRMHKMSPDLKAGIEGAQTPNQHWARDHGGRREVQVVFVSDDNADMAGLKADIASAGGKIDAAMPGLRMLTATLPANQVARIAGRSD